MMLDPIPDYLFAIIFVVVGMILMYILNKIFHRKKLDLKKVRKLVYDTGIYQREAYKGLKELEQFFKEAENAN